MNLFSRIWCRLYQGAFKLAMPMLPYREPKIIESVLGIKEILKEKNITDVLLVTDSGVRSLTRELVKDLKENEIKCTIFDGVVPNPTIDVVEEAYKIYTEKKCMAIIAFGGGSVMDAAKVIGARVIKPEQSVRKMKGLLKIRKELPLLIAIPTTAGTGSETTVTAVITDSENKRKYTINDFNLIPHYAVLDAKLTIGLPPAITATTGMDALTHAVEAYIGKSTTKETRHYALNATKFIIENITKVYDDGKNERARGHMLKGSYMAGLAFTRSYVGYVHAVAHTLGGEYHTPHGLANAVALPYVLGMYGKSAHKKLKELAVFANVARPYDGDEIAANKFINKILELNEYLNIPKKFDFIKSEDIDRLAKYASKEANPLYPVPKLMSAKELTKIYYNLQA